MKERKRLISAAEQLIAIDLLLGNNTLIPSGFSSFPEVAPLKNIPDSVENTEKDAPPTTSEPEKLSDIEKEIAACKQCELCKQRTNTVPGEGNPRADIVFVGEAPGADEDESGRPFVGRAGKLLTRMISAMGLSRDEIFICNMLKCRPPGNRHPSPEELTACWHFLSRQLSSIKPRVIITLGNPATQGLLNTRTGITKLRGVWQSMPDTISAVEGIPVMPTFHPSYVLRRYTSDTRSKVWSDLQSVMKRVGLTTPDKDKEQ